MAKLVIWIDDDRSLIGPELFDLEVLECDPRVFDLPSEALNWIGENPTLVVGATAILVDALLPRCEDPRFKSDAGKPAGLILCELLRNFEFWETIKNRVTLYTRLPEGPRLSQLKIWAKDIGLDVIPKTTTSRIAVWLRDCGRL